MYKSLDASSSLTIKRLTREVRALDHKASLNAPHNPTGGSPATFAGSSDSKEGRRRMLYLESELLKNKASNVKDVNKLKGELSRAKAELLKVRQECGVLRSRVRGYEASPSRIASSSSMGRGRTPPPRQRDNNQSYATNATRSGGSRSTRRQQKEADEARSRGSRSQRRSPSPSNSTASSTRSARSNSTGSTDSRRIVPPPSRKRGGQSPATIGRRGSGENKEVFDPTAYVKKREEERKRSRERQDNNNTSSNTEASSGRRRVTGATISSSGSGERRNSTLNKLTSASRGRTPSPNNLRRPPSPKPIVDAPLPRHQKPPTQHQQRAAAPRDHSPSPIVPSLRKSVTPSRNVEPHFEVPLSAASSLSFSGSFLEGGRLLNEMGGQPVSVQHRKGGCQHHLRRSKNDRGGVEEDGSIRSKEDRFVESNGGLDIAMRFETNSPEGGGWGGFEEISEIDRRLNALQGFLKAAKDKGRGGK